MNDVVIRAEGVGKRYRIGARQSYRTLREALNGFAAAPGRWVSSRFGRRSGSPAAQDIWALKDVGFELGRGQVLGIIGANGAGKSTLLKVLSRITEPTEGWIEIDGRTGSLLEVGTGFHPELTGRENVYLNGAIIGMTRAEIERRFDEIVSFAGVEKFVDTPVKRYSSGMYLRLAFSVAAHLETEILMVDEVLAVGDAAFQEKCLGRMSEISDQGRTILFVSHHMDSVRRLCDRVMLIEQGRVGFDGRPEHAISRYLESSLPRDSEGGRIDLSQHPGRRKSFDGLIRLTDCRLTGEGGGSAIRTGQYCKLSIGFEVKGNVRPDRVNFALMIRGEGSQRLASCWSEISGTDLEPGPGDNEAVCEVPRLPLAPGQYLLDLGCQVASHWSDFVYDAVRMDVAPGRFYESGRVSPVGTGQFLMDYSWRIQSSTTIDKEANV